MKNKNRNVLTYLDFHEMKQRRCRETVHTKQKVHNCLRVRRCRGLGAKVVPKVPLPLILKTEICMVRLAHRCT